MSGGIVPSYNRGMETGVYRYILRYSARQQIALTLLAVVSYPFLYGFYLLPKEIINGAIEAEATAFPVELLGFRFAQLDYLYLLCGLFLALVAINQGFKYAINVYRGRTGERMLRRLRYALYARLLRFPLPAFRRTSQGEVIQMITAETEPLGGFFGEAFSLPVFQGGTLLVILGFLLAQNPIMALAAVALYPLQFYLIPKLQRKVNLMGKERVRLVRRLADHIGESVSGAQEIHGHGAAAFERAEFTRRLGRIYDVRIDIYVWKFVIKFLNNTINQLGPFCFYSIGGYLAIRGDLAIGTLVAAIAAHKDLAAPWKELLAYYQRREDARIKFEAVTVKFEPQGLWPEEIQTAEPAAARPIAGEIVGSNLSLRDEFGTALVDGTAFRFDAGQRVAIIGADGSGRQELSQLIARLVAPSAGSIRIDGAPTADLPQALTGRRIGYVGPQAYVFSTDVRDNLLYGLKHRPSQPARSDAEEAVWRTRVGEAAAAGNSTDDPDADWIDYAAAAAADEAALTERAFEALALVDMEEDVYRFGLRGTIDPAARPALAGRFLEARAAFRERLSDPQIAALVETYEADAYNDNATLGENLLFGTPVGGAFDMNRLAESAYVLEVLDRAALTEDLLEIGRQVAALMVELFADLPPGHEFFEQYSFIGSDDLPEYRMLLERIGRDGMGSVRDEERTKLLSLSFMLAPARHRLGLIGEEMKRRMLEGRRLFADNLPAALSGAVEFFADGRYNAAASLQDNILFGKLAYGRAQAAALVGAQIGEAIDSLGLRPAVMEVGLDYRVGIGGARLSAAQRQKLAIARAVLKRPDLLVLDEATAGLDGPSQTRILDRLLEEFAGRGLVWALHRPSLADRFDRVLAMRDGKVVEQGSFAELDRDGSALRALTGAE